MGNPGDYMIRFDRLTRGFVCALFLGLFGSWALAQSNSAGAPAVAKAVVTPQFVLTSDAPAVAIRLDPIDPTLVDSAKRGNATTKTKRLQIGIGRDMSPELRASSETLLWTPAPGGGMAARLEITSPGASALRRSASSIERGWA